MDRLFWPAVLLLLAAMCGAMVMSALQESQTWDEAIHIAAGYSYLRTGDYRISRENPPLGKILAALPLFPLRLDLDTASEAWRNSDAVTLGANFLYRNRLPADTLLFRSRSAVIVVTLCLGLVIAIWTRRRFGVAPALLAVSLFTLDPNFIAHGHYATTDMAASFTVLLACAAWGAWLRSWRTRDLLWTALAAAAALTTKFSSLFLLPALLLLFGVRWWQEGGRARPWLRRLALSAATISLVTVAVIAVCYAKESWSFTFAKRPYVYEPSSGDRSAMPVRLLRSAVRRLQMPPYSYLVGISTLLHHTDRGHDSYVLGQRSTSGAWYYFPVAFAVKTPTAVLLLILVALAAAIAALARHSPRRWLPGLRQARFEWFVLTLPPLLYFILSVRTPINIGLRHILPIYPFLFVLIAAALFRFQGGFRTRALPALLCAAVVTQAAETARIHPHYLAFFNTVSGGPDQGARYLVDSNLDWGQELKHIQRWLRANGDPPLCLSYFGSAIMEYYGILGRPVPATWDAAGRADLDCFVGVSATLLQDVYVEPGRNAWLRERRPMGTIGHSIYLYDYRKSTGSAR